MEIITENFQKKYFTFKDSTYKVCITTFSKRSINSAALIIRRWKIRTSGADDSIYDNSNQAINKHVSAYKVTGIVQGHIKVHLNQPRKHYFLIK